MYPNELRKGDHVMYNGPMGWRKSIIADNAKGITRMIDTPNVNGSRDIGSVYVWQLATMDGQSLELTPAHEKQRDSIQAIMNVGF